MSTQVNVNTNNGIINVNNTSVVVADDDYTIETLDLNTLKIDTFFQRTEKKKHVSGIIGAFNLKAAHLSNRVVALIAGIYYLIDGQQHVAAMKKCKVTHAKCKVVKGLTKEEAAKLFGILNHKQSISTNEKHRIGVNAGLSQPKHIQSILEGLGFVTSGKGNRLGGISILNQIYRVDGGKLLYNTLAIINQAFANDLGIVDSKALNYRFVLGLSMYLDGKKLPAKKIQQLRAIGAESLTKQAKKLKDDNGGSGHCFEKELVEILTKRIG